MGGFTSMNKSEDEPREEKESMPRDETTVARDPPQPTTSDKTDDHDKSDVSMDDTNDTTTDTTAVTNDTAVINEPPAHDTSVETISSTGSKSPTVVPQKRPTEDSAHTPVKAAKMDKSPGVRNGNFPHFVYNDQPSQPMPLPPQPQHPYNPFLYPQSRSRANPPLDMGTVDSRGSTRQRFEADNSSRNDNQFKLEHIPTVYPTMEDFENRPKYMEMLHKYYGKYGMVKIVPPERWNIPFRLDTEMFWFKTRRQDLNSSLQGRSAEQCFVNDLFQFHQKHKTPILKLPSIDKRPIDVYHLFHCVHLRGGFVEVCRRKLWAQVGRELGYSGKIMTSLSTSLKSSYQKILHPFDQYLETSQGPKKYRPVMPLANYQLSSDNAVKEEAAAKQESAIDQRNSPVVGSNLLLLREGKYQPADVSISAALDDEIDDFAIQCSKIKHKVGYSGIELTPADSKNAASYNLRQFQQKCDRFDESFLGTRRKPVGKEGENFVENEYWEALGNSKLAVEVEYGSNIHSAIHGSTHAMPEQNSLRNVNDQWNLNVAPHMRDSLFQYVDDSAALQVTMPWLHVGMMFSTQSWAVEDMMLWSLDYMHFGSTRTWYCVSPSHYEKFQKLLESYVQKGDRKLGAKFVLEPDLMISPQVLKDEGIDVFICDQRPGEYVLSFPQAYRSHFCHGFDMSESVNLCPLSWLDGPAQECAELYKKYEQLPAFSYERMLLNIAKRGRLSEKEATAKRLMEVLEKEKLLRKEVRDRGVKEVKCDTKEIIFCNNTSQQLVFSYLSVMSEDEGPWEATYALDQKVDDATLKILVSDEDLDQYLDSAKYICTTEKYAETAWLRRLKDTMENRAPSLHVCRELLFDGQNINPKMTELYYLHQFVATCEHWVSRARAFLDQGKRSYDRKDREGPVDKEPEVPQVSREEITLLVEGFNQMPFTCSESDDFFDCLRNLEQLASDVQYALHDPNCTYTPIEYIRLVHEVRHASIAIPYADQLYQLCTKLRWCEKALGLVDRACAETIQSTLREGDLMGFNMSEVAYRELMSHLQHVVNQGPEYVPPLTPKEKNVNFELKLEQEDVVMEDVETRSTSPSTADTEDTHMEMQLVAHIDPPEISLPSKFIENPVSAAKITPRPASHLSHKPVDTTAALEESTELETAGDGSLSIDYSEMCIQLGSESVDKRPEYKTAAELLALAEAEDDVSLPTLQTCMKTNEEWLKRGKQTFYRRSGANKTMMTRLRGIYKSLNLVTSSEDTYERDVHALEAEEKGEPLEPAEAKLFCFCRQRESGVMVGCDKCAEWYHSKCLKNAGVKTKSQEEFICHICDSHVPTTWKDYRPSLAEIEDIFQQSHWLPLQSPEVVLLQHVIQKTCEFKEWVESHVIKNVSVENSTLTHEEARFYLRKLEGVEVVIPELVDYFRNVVWKKDPVGDMKPVTAEETLKMSKICGKKKEKKEKELKELKEVKKEAKKEEVKKEEVKEEVKEEKKDEVKVEKEESEGI